VQHLVDRLGPQPHLGAAAGIRRLQRRIGKDFVDVLADDSRFDDGVPIMKEGRHHGLGVELHVVGIELLALQNIDVVAFPFEAFLAQRQAHLCRAHGRAVMK